jgi:DNA-binding SARP family transcriptional activator
VREDQSHKGGALPVEEDPGEDEATGAAVEACLLGVVRIISGPDMAIANRFGGAQVAEVAAYLLLAEGAWVSKDLLAEAIWGDAIPATWQASLRNTISRVRAWLGAAGLDGSSALRAGDGGWALALPPMASLDLVEARRRVELAESALAQGSPERARQLGGRAARVLEQPLAAETDAPWADQARHEVLQWQLRALDVTADGGLAVGDWPAAVEAANAAVELDPYREASHRRLIVAHDGAGDRAEALRSYERCRHRLAEDLGLSPTPETEATYLRVLGSDVPVDRVAAVAPPEVPSRGLPEAGHTVGRDEELTRFGRLDRVARFARRQVIIVRGPAGIGKTHVTLRFAELQVAAGRTVLFGRAPRTNVPYGVFVDALTRYIRSADPTSMRDVLGWAAPVLAEIVPALASRRSNGDRDPATPDTIPRDFHLAFVEAFRRLTGLGPVLLIADDVDRCDENSVDLLRHLCEQELPGLLVLGTIRSGEPLSPELEDLLEMLAQVGGLHEVALEPLTEEAVAALAANRLGIGRPDPALMQLLTSQADGSPLLVTQLLDLLAESQVLDPTSGSVDPNALASLGLPKGTADVVRRRLRRITPPALRIARLVAVFGDEMPIEILGDLAADGVDLLLDAIELLCAADLLVVDADRPGIVRFRHALIAAAVREELGITRRAHLHLSIGLHLLAMTDKGEPLAAAAAEHLQLAGDLTPPDARCRARLEAGRRAMALSTLTETLVHLQAALDDLEAVSLPVQADVWCTLGDAHRGRFEREAAQDAYERAMDLARAIGDEQVLVRAINGLASSGGVGEPIKMDLGERHELLREGLAAVGDSDSVERTRLLGNYALARYGLPDADESGRAAMAMARRLRSPNAFVAGLAAERQVEAGPAHIEDRHRYLDQLVALHGPHLSGPVAVQVEQGRLHDAIESGDRAETDRALRALVDQADQMGRPFQSWWAATWKVTGAIIDGDLTLAEREAEQAWALTIDPPDDMATMTYAGVLAGMRLLQGREVEIVQPLEGAVGSGWDIPLFRAALACAQARTGDLSSARKSYDRLMEEDPVRTIDGLQWSASMYVLTQLAQLLGDQSGGEDLATGLVPHARALVVVSGAGASGGSFLGSIAQLLGDLAALAGRWAEASSHFETALADHRSFRAPIFVALSAYGLAVALERTGQRGDRATMLRAEAQSAASHCGVVLREPGTGRAATE